MRLLRNAAFGLFEYRLRLRCAKVRFDTNFKEFDPGSGRTLAARLTHASRTELVPSGTNLVADG